MGSLGNTLMGVAKKSYCYVTEYTLVLVQWKLKIIKAQLKKWQRCSAQKQLDKAYASFGAEAYAAFRGGDKELGRTPLFEQKVKEVEAAEAALFAVDEAIDQVNDDYLAKKEELKEKYQTKRSLIGTDSEE
jgi:hypothetical protein